MVAELPDQLPEHERILFIDDEPMNLLGFKALFRRRYEVYTAGSAEEALQLLEVSAMHAVVSDQRMPRMKGTEFFAVVSDRSRTGKRVILTGYSADQEIQEALSSGIIDAVIDKPLRGELLQRLLEARPATPA